MTTGRMLEKWEIDGLYPDAKQTGRWEKRRMNPNLSSRLKHMIPNAGPQTPNSHGTKARTRERE